MTSCPTLPQRCGERPRDARRLYGAFLGKGPDPLFEPLVSQFATIQSSLRVSVRNVIVSVGELASAHKRSMIIK